MKTSALLAALTFMPLLAAFTHAAIKTDTIEYKEGETVLEGFLAYDDANTKARPGVLVIHDWTGVQDYAKDRAKQLAALGYVAFCADIYGKGVRPTDPKDCAEQAGKYKADRPLLRRRVQAGLAILEMQKLASPGKIAAIGYCFGGTTALEIGRSGADVKAIVGFHSGLAATRPEEARNIKGKVLACIGAEDPLIPPEQRAAFEQEMAAARIDWRLQLYGGIGHSFTNPDIDTRKLKGFFYHADTDRRSWNAMIELFVETLS